MARLNFGRAFPQQKSLPEIRQELHTMGVFVQALASRGVATALSGALLSTRPVDQLVVSPTTVRQQSLDDSESPW